MAGRVLQSKWSGLNENLLASIYPVDFNGKAEADGATVKSPLTEANIEMTGNWQSAFENAGPESKAPTIMAMLQSGSLSNYLQAFFGKADPTSENDGVLNGILSQVEGFATRAQGRAGMTKLNSTQIYTGSAPVKISGTLHFRAFDDPDAEVQQPADQLSKWMLPKSLSASGSIVALVEAFKSKKSLGDVDFVSALLPSQAPQLLGFRYGGYTFSPLVMESIGRPLTTPMTRDGKALNVSIPFTLASLTALDAGDWDLARRGQPTKLFPR